MALSERKKKILAAVVDAYIETAEPVGSKAIAQSAGLGCSSATIRNELAELVAMGYLEQPHTSAGRVPTAMGYRLYVNELMERKALSDEETAEINRSLSGTMAGMDEVISRAGQMVSSFVGYPTYTVADHKQAVTVQRFELIGVSEDSFIAVVMLSDSRVKSQLMHLELPVSQDRLPELSHLLNTHFTQIGPAEMNTRLMSLSDQVDGQRFLLLNQTVEYAGGLLAKSGQQEVFTNGASQLLKFPEYRDVDKAQKLMDYLSDESVIRDMPQDGEGGVRILIGPENVAEELRDSGVVLASYDMGNDMRGVIGVVGPTRMDYAKVAAYLRGIAMGMQRAALAGMPQPPPQLTAGTEHDGEKR